jgi:hypothetical protein
MSPGGAGKSETLLIRWQMDVPLLTNRFILYDLAKLTIISALIMFVLVEGMILVLEGLKWDVFVNMALMAGFACLGLAVLMVLVMLLFFWNRFPMGFALSEEGAAVTSQSRRGQVANRLAVIIGALAGKPGVAGAGMLGMAQEEVGIGWPEVERLNIHPGPRVISLMNSWRVVLRLYCTPENFPAVRQQVEDWWQGAAKKREARLRRRVRLPWGSLLLKSALAVLAAIFLQALPFPVPSHWIVAAAALALAAIWDLPVRHLAGLATLAAVALFIIFTLVHGFETYSLFDENLYRALAREKGWPTDQIPAWVRMTRFRFQRLQVHEWLGTAVAGLSLAYFTFLGLSAWRDRGKKGK